jgi:hypothetical protein
MYKRPHNRRLKHLSLVWQSLCLDMYMKMLRGPFREQLGNLSGGEDWQSDILSYISNGGQAIFFKGPQLFTLYDSLLFNFSG